MPKRLQKSGESLAQRVVQRVLGRRVEVNDDGSAPGMYDLRVGPENRPEVAIECVGSVDPAFVELWNIGPATSPWTLSLQGDWAVCLSRGARIRDIRAELEELLQDFETGDVRNGYEAESPDHEFSPRMKRLCITSALCYRPVGSGKVSLSVTGGGGVVDEYGTAVPKWLGDFLRDRDRADVLRKLERSGASQRHVFVIATLMGTPWPVASYLVRVVHVPQEAPDLPPPVTAAWVVATAGPNGLYWDGATWQIVSTLAESS